MAAQPARACLADHRRRQGPKVGISPRTGHQRPNVKDARIDSRRSIGTRRGSNGSPRIDGLTGDEAVRSRKPDIVYASLNCYGQTGPYAGRPGHEQIAQAATGIQTRYGGDRPALQPYPVNDYGTGLMGAFGVALALLHRKRTG